MQFTVHDVGHGQCISLRADNGNSILWDCGHKEGSRPSEFLPQLGWKSIQYLILTNFDADHVSDLAQLCRVLHIETCIRNGTVSPEALRALKLAGGPLTEGLTAALELHREYVHPMPSPPPPLPDVEWTTYCNTYGVDFDDTNNLSLVTFARFRGVSVVIPGDLEVPGWQCLLKNPAFRRELGTVNLFVASHHGRESGYCPEVFDYARNVEVVVFSDSPIQHATQEMANVYASHASGTTFDGQPRKVLSTRSDGSMLWDR